jgi:hypothetical protein
MRILDGIMLLLFERNWCREEDGLVHWGMSVAERRANSVRVKRRRHN